MDFAVLLQMLLDPKGQAVVLVTLTISTQAGIILVPLVLSLVKNAALSAVQGSLILVAATVSAKAHLVKEFAKTQVLLETQFVEPVEPALRTTALNVILLQLLQLQMVH